MSWFQGFLKWLRDAPEQWDYKLTRLPEVEDGTFGTLFDKQGNPLCNTVEPNWRDNQIGLSCIPAGVYDVKPYSSPKYPDVWILEGTEPRKLILIHNGNTEDHTEGCIVVGSGFGVVGRKKAVLRSKDTLTKLKGVLPDSFKLKIENAL